MHVLITGGAGFIGSHLVDHLLAETDATITALDNFSTGVESNLAHVDSDRLNLVTGDVRDETAVRETVEEADEVYHLAAAVGVEKIVDEPLKSLQINLTGTENILEAAVEDKTPVYLASSSEIYGRNEETPFSETDNCVLGPPTATRWSYATAKAADEYMALGYNEKYDLPVVIGRFFNTVGPRQTGQYGMVVPTFVEQALNDEPLTVYGDGTQTRCFGHVHDVVEIVHKLMTIEDAYGEVFNIGAPEPTTINALAERVIELTNSNSEITHILFEEVYGEDFEEPDHRKPDVSKLRDTVGWAPNTELDAILEDVIAERSNMKVIADD